MSRVKKIKSVNVSDVRVQLLNIADSTAMLYDKTDDLKAAELALKSYNAIPADIGPINPNIISITFLELESLSTLPL